MAVTANPNQIDSTAVVVYALSDSTGFSGVLFDTGGMYVPLVSLDAGTDPLGETNGAGLSLAVSASARVIQTSNINLDSRILSGSLSGFAGRVSRIELSQGVTLSTDLDGQIFSGTLINMEGDVLDVEVAATAAQSSVLVPSEGDTYIVVNLRTRSHTTYKDGTNTATFKTGLLHFNSAYTKTIQDVYLLSRSGGDITLTVDSGEGTRRSYAASYQDDGDREIRNKKVSIAKGLKATSWALGASVPETTSLYLASTDLLVAEQKRRV